MNKLKQMISIPRLNLTLLVVLVAFISYRLFAPITPAVYDKPIVQNVKSIQAGHQMTYKLHSCRYVGEGAITTVTRKLISTKDKTLQPIILSTDTFTNEAKCSDVTKSLIVPYSTPAGTYQLVVTGVYQVIPFRTPITVTATSDSFNIKPATIGEDLQALINSNKELQKQIKKTLEKTPVYTSPVQGSGSTQQQTTNSVPNNSVATTPKGNTTTDNTGGSTGGNQGGGQNNGGNGGNGGGETPNKGLITGLLELLGGGNISLHL